MWDLLKSKLANFISKIKGEEETAEAQRAEIKETAVSEPAEAKSEAEVPSERPEARKELAGLKQEAKQPKPEIIKEKPRTEAKPAAQPPMPEIRCEPRPEAIPGTPQALPAKNERVPFAPVAADTGKEGIEIKVGFADKLKKALLGKVRLSSGKVEEITDELEFSLIQADVHPDVAAEICRRIKDRLGDREFTQGDLEKEIKGILKQVFEEEAFGSNKVFDLVEKVRAGKKPYKILFVGPNGAGKTTTIAKVAKMLMDAGFTVVISASDTFRAAAIEQTEEHGRRLGVRVIRQNYGADAAAVAFDAIKHAEANKIDAVLIDSAGRQDTNLNLLKELQKISRIANPDAKIFIGESLAGNSLYQQVGKFKEMIGLDGIILTKADCDAKGGAAISILRETGVPIIYLGMGQAYTDLRKFDPKYIIDNLI